THTFESHVVWSEGDRVVLDRTYFYPTGGGQISDTGRLGERPVVEVERTGPWVVHRLDAPSPFHAGERVRGAIDSARRLQLMQHHTATHLLNGALREALGPHVWQAGAHKAPESARIDITHFSALSRAEIRAVERRVNALVREDRPVKSYFESRTEAERRFGFTLYQGGAVPGRELRIVEIEGFDVEACGGTHCTHTSEVGLVTILGTERIQDGIVRLQYAAGERALDLVEERAETLSLAAQRLSVPPERLLEGLERLEAEVEAARKRDRVGQRRDTTERATALLADPAATRQIGRITVTWAKVPLDRAGLMELSRSITREPDHVALLGGESEGRGLLFVGSSAPTVRADRLLSEALARFGGRGGGNASAATGVGEPGRPLEDALDHARQALSATLSPSPGGSDTPAG
ncbi:MAG TPA: alanine--tRNA ligase-related protein, partial [Thermoplasmata archaeon]|nr:alanine--tRNA ligase-related protein [Thermoplasmata archaeon]